MNPPAPAQPPVDEPDLSDASPVEAVQVIHDCLAERDRVEIKRILKSACALLDIECEFHDVEDDEG